MVLWRHDWVKHIHSGSQATYQPYVSTSKTEAQEIQARYEPKDKGRGHQEIKAKVLRVVGYSTWLANIVPFPKKDGKVRGVHWLSRSEQSKP